MAKTEATLRETEQLLSESLRDCDFGAEAETEKAALEHLPRASANKTHLYDAKHLKVELCTSCWCFKAQQGQAGRMLIQLIQKPRESAARCTTKVCDVNVPGRPGRQRVVDWKTLQCCEEAQNEGDESFG